MLNDSARNSYRKSPSNQPQGKIPRFLVLLLIFAAITALILYFCIPKSQRPSLNEPETAAQTEPPKPEPPKFRYREVSQAGNFGAPLDFSRALHGNALDKKIPYASEALSGIIVDMDTRRVLWERNCRKDVPIASMTKMMTLLVAMETLEADPARTLDDEITVTKCVMQIERTGLAFLEPGEKITFRELLGCAVIKSANDAAQQIAEVSAGSVDNFVEKMNQKSQDLGLSAKFTNPHGLTVKGVTSTASALDMVLLGERLLEYPVVMDMMKLQEFSIRNGKTKFVSTNKLINPRYPGVDGMKTGYTRKAGSCLTFSVLRNQRRIMGCVTGFKTGRDRDKFCRKLIDWAYQQK
ncbi:MAG: D-alanyl-D-alanine carboxypeptidase [Victivallaceae bacterium]|nr:D-alanyl-D-alanine carboxypeptidase [Victivallaceae bacterium]